jgi:hypothetical protein
MDFLSREQDIFASHFGCRGVYGVGFPCGYDFGERYHAACACVLTPNLLDFFGTPAGQVRGPHMLLRYGFSESWAGRFCSR